MTVGMLVDPRAERLRQHLRAKADPEIWLALPERHADPFDLALDDLVVIVGALRAAEDHRGGVLVEGVGQRIAEPRPPDVEPKATLLQLMADAAGRGQFAVENDQDGRSIRAEKETCPQIKAIQMPIHLLSG